MGMEKMCLKEDLFFHSFFSQILHFLELRGPSWVHKWRCTHRAERRKLLSLFRKAGIPSVTDRKASSKDQWSHDTVMYQRIREVDTSQGERSFFSYWIRNCTLVLPKLYQEISQLASTRYYPFQVFPSSEERAAYFVCDCSRGKCHWRQRVWIIW